MGGFFIHIYRFVAAICNDKKSKQTNKHLILQTLSQPPNPKHVCSAAVNIYAQEILKTRNSLEHSSDLWDILVPFFYIFLLYSVEEEEEESVY